MLRLQGSLLAILATLSSGLQGAPAANNNYAMSTAEAVEYIKHWRPKADGVTDGFLKTNAELALKTQELPYAKEVSRDMFLSYVLPYAHFDEPRDDWRPKMYKTLLPYVKDKKTLKEAADALFPAWGNAFGKQLKFKPNMTPECMAPFSETLAKGHASCTGMSIFLADCLRAVGIPARIVGVAEWNRLEKGNHNWVEVWMGDRWNFVDAVPSPDRAAWNQTWFNDQAKKQIRAPSHYAIMAPLWGPQANSVYNMSWRTPSQFVPSIDVTSDYTGGVEAAQNSSVGIPMVPGILLLLGLLGLGGVGYAYKTGKQSGEHERLA